MIQINAPVLTYDGLSVPTGTVCSIVPYFGNATPIYATTPPPSGSPAGTLPTKSITGYNLPCSFQFWVNQTIQANGYMNIIPIVDAVGKKRIDSVSLVLTPDQMNSPTKPILEGIAQVYLGNIYGASNVVIING
jgi:hypothetical protein